MIDLHDEQALLNAVGSASLPVAFLVGSALSIDAQGGVPGVSMVIDMARQYIESARPSALPAFEQAVGQKSGGEAYQSAMRWLQGNLLQDSVNELVKKAVLKARRNPLAADLIDDGSPSDWQIPRGTLDLCRLVSVGGQFSGPILTTNFDPLLSLAIRSYGGRAKLRVIQSDGRVEHEIRESSVCEVVHLHGYWRGADTLHTPAQLSAPRPKLSASLQHLLRQKTLVVIGYGGWDDVFTQALADVLSDDHSRVNVLWCFLETDPTLISAKYEPLLKRLAPAITRGRFLCYGGIDCHSVFARLGDVAPEVASPSSAQSPLAGWQRIDAAGLARQPSLSADELIRYFDGATPTWSHAVSPSIPRRHGVAELVGRLVLSGRPDRCSLQLIRAAGGEGKTTLLLQAAADACRSAGCTVLWRPAARVGLSPEHVVGLDPSTRWLLVADDAENLVEELSESARALNDQRRTNVHFLLAARDTDWVARFGDTHSWESWTWLDAWVRRGRAVELRGIDRTDAVAVVQAWAACGADGLRELAKLAGPDERADALLAEVREVTREENKSRRYRHERDGSFFGALLGVRFGQEGLQAHVRTFLERLKRMGITQSASALSDALIYAAACHAVGIPGVDENVLADLVGVPREWVQSRVVKPLGEEAAAVRSAGQVLTRHRKVAEAVLVEADQTIDLEEIWSSLVLQTVRTSRETKVGQSFQFIVNPGPRLVSELPHGIPGERRTEIAIAAARAAVAASPDLLGCVVSLGKTYRDAGRFGDAITLFQESVDSIASKQDHRTRVRAFWCEWAVVEGSLGRDPSSALLQGVAVSDLLNDAPITPESARRSLCSLAWVFGRLALKEDSQVFNLGRRAMTYLGRRAQPDERAEAYIARHDRSADQLRTPHPADVGQAISWLTQAVAAVARLVDDTFLLSRIDLKRISFERLQAFCSSKLASAESDAPSTPVERASRATVETPPPAQPIADVAIVSESRQTDRERLRYSVWAAIRELSGRSIFHGRPLLLATLGHFLSRRFPEHRPVHQALGFSTLSALIESFEDFRIAGDSSRWEVHQGPTPAGDLRSEVACLTRRLLDETLRGGRACYLAWLGIELAHAFPEAKPIHTTLGFKTLSELVQSYDDFSVVTTPNGVQVQPRTTQSPTTRDEEGLRFEVGEHVRDLLDRSKSEEQPLYLATVGWALSARFPDARPVQRFLGYDGLTSLVESFADLVVVEERQQRLVRYKSDLAASTEPDTGTASSHNTTPLAAPPPPPQPEPPPRGESADG